MCKTMREKYLNEYIEELDIDEGLKQRMLELWEKAEEEKRQQAKWLDNCHLKINKLENAILELGIEFGRTLGYLREMR